MTFTYKHCEILGDYAIELGWSLTEIGRLKGRRSLTGNKSTIVESWELMDITPAGFIIRPTHRGLRSILPQNTVTYTTKNLQALMAFFPKKL